MSYKDTINLPNTEFPMRANLSERELDFQKIWEENNIYEKAVKNREGKESFILHDGPPYANGDIHIGHALNKILKDFVTRFATLKGYYSPYVPGWDTHGLPIEHQVKSEMSDQERKDLSVEELREKCTNYALKYIDRQREQFKRLGVWGEWDAPYLTLSPEYEVKQIEVFGEMAKKDLFYRGKKPVHWCPHCETALAEAEVEYGEDRAPSIYVKFPLKEKFEVGGVSLNKDNSYVVIWTTTPWTLPANMAIAFHPEYPYVVVEAEGENLIMAKELVSNVMEISGIEEYEIISDEFSAKELENKKCRHPFEDRDSLLILGEHVTLEQGTGCVHTAPGHGHDDFVVGHQEYGLDVYAPMDNRGYFTEKAGDFAGKSTDEVNIMVTDKLKEKNLLMDLSFIDHQYPHCWRCKGNLLFRATDQWFASIDAIKEKTLKAISEVEWHPSWGEERMKNMISERSDWCISRQKKWGVPIPIFYCDDCEEAVINDDTLDSVKKIFAVEGSSAWYKYPAEKLLPKDYSCPHCDGSSFTKEEDIMDVWFDSGSSHKAVLETRENLSWPAQIYLEGTDQYRGWFNSSLLTAVATEGRAPYNEVITNGFTVDDKGNKMSKSQGNVVSPHKVIDQYGADILRLWVASSDFKNDVKVSDNILKQNSEVYRRIRNTYRFVLGNVSDFDKEKNYVKYEDRKELDRWIMIRLQDLIKKVTSAYEKYEYHRVYHDVHNFCTVEMSSLYMDITKDRLYTDGTDSLSRRSAQSTLYDIMMALVVMLAPLLPHTSEEVWQFLGDKVAAKESVFLSDWPELKKAYYDQELTAKWADLLNIRKDVSKALELARADKKIGNSLEAGVELKGASEAQLELLENELEQLADLFIVSQVELNDQLSEGEAYLGEESSVLVKVNEAKGDKCDRCWKYDESVGKGEEHKDICNRCASVIESE
ncbi:isoleucine--tRNA ligase [Halanaerobium sp. Z-7514]|uniref:Isoleucine--tRNA ligase n=1 Tax=Halanaerobium polyolivorans TaxID=2886943 RepID=A0AAW4WXP6_9FIRM|nr:isoleucine--tRNA ligase [Halanaerobium polyolivorans]MCC3144758.1 isoleucine--tRNA ligase [Halanaerobium polyolivorans]